MLRIDFTSNCNDVVRDLFEKTIFKSDNHITKEIKDNKKDVHIICDINTSQSFLFEGTDSKFYMAIDVRGFFLTDDSEEFINNVIHELVHVAQSVSDRFILATVQYPTSTRREYLFRDVESEFAVRLPVSEVEYVLELGRTEPMISNSILPWEVEAISVADSIADDQVILLKVTQMQEYHDLEDLIPALDIKEIRWICGHSPVYVIHHTTDLLKSYHLADIQLYNRVVELEYERRTALYHIEA